MHILLLLAASWFLLGSARAFAQWEMQETGTTADLRGISSAGGGTAWASGSHGTVLRTEDSGFVWQGCATPAGGRELDFRAVHAFDAKTAVVMSSGKGALSRVYKTTDGCVTWKLLFTNPDKEGFFDSLQAADALEMMIAGDPVDGAFRLWWTTDGGTTWKPEKSQPALPGEGAFAASNQALSVQWKDGLAAFGTGSPAGARLFLQCDPCGKDIRSWVPREMAMFSHGATAGIFAIGQSDWKHLVALGGDYKQPEGAEKNAAYSTDAGHHWMAAATLPHGYRSAVAYDSGSKAWITVGPNGTDVSADDGKHWSPLHPASNDAADADRSWNALALPFAVGPKGRIGRLREGVLAGAAAAAR